jgi:hypothetical protein
VNWAWREGVLGGGEEVAMAAARDPHRWSGEVTQHSDALDLEPEIFRSNDPAEIARSLKHSAETSHRRKSKPYRSAMSMLTFYINRAGKNLPAKRKRVLEDAKDALSRAFGRSTQGP